jgi:hypothetical protein
LAANSNLQWLLRVIEQSRQPVRIAQQHLAILHAAAKASRVRKDRTMALSGDCSDGQDQRRRMGSIVEDLLVGHLAGGGGGGERLTTSQVTAETGMRGNGDARKRGCA